MVCATSASVKADEQLKTIPIVVFTTSAADDDIQASYGANANAYVTKPLDLDAFQRVLDKIHAFYGGIVARAAPPHKA